MGLRFRLALLTVLSASSLAACASAPVSQDSACSDTETAARFPAEEKHRKCSTELGLETTGSIDDQTDFAEFLIAHDLGPGTLPGGLLADFSKRYTAKALVPLQQLIESMVKKEGPVRAKQILAEALTTCGKSAGAAH